MPHRAELPDASSAGLILPMDDPKPSILTQWHMHSATGQTVLEVNHSARWEACLQTVSAGNGGGERCCGARWHAGRALATQYAPAMATALAPAPEVIEADRVANLPHRRRVKQRAGGAAGNGGRRSSSSNRRRSGRCGRGDSIGSCRGGQQRRRRSSGGGSHNRERQAGVEAGVRPLPQLMLQLQHRVDAAKRQEAQRAACTGEATECSGVAAMREKQHERGASACQQPEEPTRTTSAAPCGS